MSHVFDTIREFNDFYGLPNPPRPTLEAVDNVRQRILGFAKTMRDELDEGLEILEKMNNGASDLELLTDLSDWLGDLIVYSASEAAKYGIPTERVLEVIMESNFSKKQPDGSVLKDEHGKVCKGTAYWKPEPLIEAIIKGELE